MVAVPSIRERRPRFVPAQAIAEFAALAKAYGIWQVHGDKFAGGFHASEWRSHGLTFVEAERSTSENYLGLLPLMLAGRVRLVDSATLRNQLSSLERRVGAQDRETVGHPQHASAHDDLATAAAGAIVLLATEVTLNYERAFAWDDGPAPVPCGWPGQHDRFVAPGNDVFARWAAQQREFEERKANEGCEALEREWAERNRWNGWG